MERRASYDGRFKKEGRKNSRSQREGQRGSRMSFHPAEDDVEEKTWRNVK